MKKGYTHVSILLDRSGSMNQIADDVRGGIKSFIEEQQKIDGECTISIYQFDDKFETNMSMVDIKSINPNIEFKPRGWTALYDAIGRSTNETGTKLNSIAESARPENVIFVIFTDGMENSSKEYSYDDIKKIIKEQTEKYNWNFVYLGANQDAMKVGGGLGLNIGSTMTYDVNNTDFVYSNLSSKISGVRNNMATVVDFNDDDRKKAVENV